MEKVSQKKNRKEQRQRAVRSSKEWKSNRKPESAGQTNGKDPESRKQYDKREPERQYSGKKPEKREQYGGGKSERQGQYGSGKLEKQGQKQYGGGKPERQGQYGSGKPEKQGQKRYAGGKPEKREQYASEKSERQAQYAGKKPEKQGQKRYAGGKPEKQEPYVSGRLGKQAQEQYAGRKPARQVQEGCRKQEGQSRNGGRQKTTVHPQRQGEAAGMPQCPVARRCGGCRGFSLSYHQQLRKKEKVLEEQCGQFGRFEPIIGMQDPYHYRNKVHAVFGEDRQHNIISGIYEEGTHWIVPVDSCLLEDRKADEIIVSIRGLLKSFKIRPYDEDRGYGLLRHVLIRTGRATGEIMVVLVLTSPVLPSKNNFVKALLKLHPEITTIVLNVNGKDTSMVLGEKESVLYGKGYIEDILLGKTFRISSRSFYQVNPGQTEKLYQKAVEYAALTGREIVLDAYCGTGTIGLIACDKAKEVIGVELNPAAVKDARINAKQNHAANITFYQNDAGQFIGQMAEQNAVVDVVFMDPPRAGSTEPFLDSLAALKPQKIVYVSCNPETLARDLRYLKRKGYRMEKGVGVDMFPWTGSIEAVVLLSR